MSFCFCTDQKEGAKNVCEVDQELVGGEWSTFCVPEGGESEASKKEKNILQISAGVPGAGGVGAWLQVKLNQASSVHFICRRN